MRAASRTRSGSATAWSRSISTERLLPRIPTAPRFRPRPPTSRPRPYAQTIDLTWIDNSAFEDGYEVQRCCQPGWSVVAGLPANATTYRDAGLVTNAQYYYLVRAKKD